MLFIKLLNTMSIKYTQYNHWDKIIIFWDEYEVDGFPWWYYLKNRNWSNSAAIRLWWYTIQSFMRKVRISHWWWTFPEHKTLEDLSKSIFYLKRLNLCKKK